jgi:hypothetical protein
MTFTVHIREAKVVKVIVGVEETLPAADWINWCKQAHASPSTRRTAVPQGTLARSEARTSTPSRTRRTA